MFSGKIPFESVELNELELLLQTGERPSLPADDSSRRHDLNAEIEDLIQDNLLEPRSNATTRC
jgi:hypothetical protein